MEYELIKANPANNITILVPDPPEAEKRAALAKAIMEDPALGAEQAGFIIPPAAPGDLWRLEMMGGEFCGNAARSFGLYAAARQGLTGKVRLEVAISGAAKPVAVSLNTETSWAEADMPLPLLTSWEGGRAQNPRWGPLRLEDMELPVIVFEGITHVIAENLEPSGRIFSAIQAQAEAMGRHSDALGVLFTKTNQGKLTMQPAVYVYATDTLVFESSCGSGAAALCAYHSRNLTDGEEQYPIAQPGGIIESRILKRGGEILSIAIGGKVTLETIPWEWRPGG